MSWYVTLYLKYNLVDSEIEIVFLIPFYKLIIVIGDEVIIIVSLNESDSE